MKYNEALAVKASANLNQIEHLGVTMEVYVAPALPHDFMRYINAVKGNWRDMTDGFSIHYSTNEDFVLCGIWFDGANTLHHIINIQP